MHLSTTSSAFFRIAGTIAVFSLVILTLSGVGLAQACDPPKIVANANSSNFFSAEQEMIVGELTLARMSGEFRQIQDPVLLAYIESIGAKLIKHLPPTGLKFTFHLVEYPSANAFNIPGGHVFITRKLVAFSNTEDELASVIAHELGHATVHHGAQDLSIAMKKLLNITSVGDRKDIIDKYNLVIENARTKRASARRGHENDQQLEADKIGFFSMVAAGYDPNASFTFFDRLTESEGKTGSWFSDIFGGGTPEQKRLREIAQAASELPQACRDGRSAKATEDFLKWQADVVGFREAEREEKLPGLLWKKQISPKIRSDVNKITFSQDGKYLLVTDDFAVTVIEREGAKVLRQIAAEGVSEAYFTQNNSQVVFVTNNLRFERWDVASGKAIEIRELVLRQNCWEDKLSPDGNYLACVDLQTNVNLIETKTGKRVFEKKQFYPLTSLEYFSWLRAGREETSRVSFFRIGFTPDSRFAMFSRSNKFRFRFSVDGLTYDESENTVLGVDLTTMKPIDVGGDLKKVAARSYAFIDPTRVIGNTAAKVEAGGIFSFPAGKRLQKLEFGGEEISATSDPNFLTVKPVSNFTTGIFDVSKTALVTAMNKNDIAVWKNIMAFESTSGKIVLRELKIDDANKTNAGVDLATIEIPVSNMSGMRTAEISDDFGWLVMSTKTRGGVWNLKTGERKVFTRGFMGGVVDPKGMSVAEFPRFQGEKHTLALLNSDTGQGVPIRELPEYGSKTYGRFLINRKSLDTKESKETKPTDGTEGQFPLVETEKAESKLGSNVSFELVDWVQNKVMWKRDFTGAVPRYSFDNYSGRLIFYWRLTSDEGKSKLKEDPAMAAKAASLGNKDGDYLIEVIDAFQQKTVGSMLLETGKGSFFVSSGQSEREWLVLRDSEDRVIVYSLNDGTLRHRFFGTHAAINPTQNQIVVENFPGEVALYSLDTGDKVADFAIKGDLTFARFSLDGKRLFLFSDSQTGYAVDLTKVK